MTVHDQIQTKKTTHGFMRRLVMNRLFASVMAPLMLLTSIAAKGNGVPADAVMKNLAVKEAKTKVISLLSKINRGTAFDENANPSLRTVRDTATSVSGLYDGFRKTEGENLSDDELLKTSAYLHNIESGFEKTKQAATPDTLDKEDFGTPMINGKTDIIKTSDQKTRAIWINGKYYPHEHHPGTDFHADKGSAVALTREAKLVKSYIEPSTRIGHVVLDVGNNNQDHLLHVVLPKKKYPVGYVFHAGETITTIAGKYLYGESKEQKPHLHWETHHIDEKTGKDIRENSTDAFKNDGLLAQIRPSETGERLGGFVTGKLVKSETEQQFDETANDLQQRLQSHKIRTKTFNACMVSFTQAKEMIHETALASLHEQRSEESKELASAVNDLAVVLNMNENGNGLSEYLQNRQMASSHRETKQHPVRENIALTTGREATRPSRLYVRPALSRLYV